MYTVAEKQITRRILNGNAATAVLLTYTQSRAENNITFIDSIIHNLFFYSIVILCCRLDERKNNNNLKQSNNTLRQGEKKRRLCVTHV